MTVDFKAKCHILLSSRDIRAAVSRLAAEIDRDYRHERPVLIAVLKGSFIFLADLIRQLDLPLEVDFISLSSYGSGRETSGQIKVRHDLCSDIAGRQVLVIDDIVDTGLTTSFLVDYLHSKGPASIRVCALTDKPSRRLCPVHIDYLGFTVADKFLVGYGLDCDEKFRNLPDICFLDKE